LKIDSKYELLNPLPDWCYIDIEIEEMEHDADVIENGVYYRKIEPVVDEIDEFIDNLL
jgi:hypothetical protein